MSTYDRLAGLRLEVESCELEPLVRDVSSAFTRHTTVVRLRGGGEEGVGEDTTYDGDPQRRFQESGPGRELAGSHTLDSFSALLRDVESHRRWAFESAALDLALRQAGRSLAEAFGREARPVRFVVSLRLPDPPSLDRINNLLAHYPGTHFKLDPTSAWSERLVGELAALQAVEVVDLKGVYKGTIVDQRPDARLYRLVAEGFPEAWIEDPDLTEPAADAALEPHRDRITWDAPIHSVADIEALPFPPRMLNFKPSRFGSARSLLDAYDYCEAGSIGIYGGGQFELGPGRGQIQYLASLFHPDAPNDVAPSAYNDPVPGPGLATSPLPAEPSATGFRFGELR